MSWDDRFILTKPDRFILELDGRVWDRQEGKHYSSLAEIYPLLEELNNLLANYDSFIEGDIDALAEEFQD